MNVSSILVIANNVTLGPQTLMKYTIRVKVVLFLSPQAHKTGVLQYLCFIKLGRYNVKDGTPSGFHGNESTFLHTHKEHKQDLKSVRLLVRRLSLD